MALSAELLSELKQAIANGDFAIDGLDARGRSPLRPRQLHDLTLVPTKDDPRPTFFWSVEKPRNGEGIKTSEFPKLMWQPTSGQEITVLSAQMQAERLREGYVLHCPANVVIDPFDAVRASWDALSSEDQDILRESARQDRINAIRAKLGNMDPSKIEAMMATADEPKRKRA